MRKSRNGGGSGLLKASGVIATLLVAVYVVTIWAMGAKPDLGMRRQPPSFIL